MNLNLTDIDIHLYILTEYNVIRMQIICGRWLSYQAVGKVNQFVYPMGIELTDANTLM